MLQALSGVLTLISLFFTGAQAAPYNYQGHFRFQSQMDVLVSKSNLWVRVGTASGEKVLNDLRADGYICTAQPQYLFACSKFKKLDLLPETRRRLQAQYTDFSIEFKSAKGDFALVNDSEFLKEWEREQKILINSLPFHKVRHMEGSQFTKIQVINADGKETEWFNIGMKNDGYELRYPLHVSQKRDRNVKEIIDSFDTFLVELVLEETR